MPELSYSVSLTSRPLRGNEQNGVEYYFVSKEEFLRLIDAGEFLEWAEVYGNYYGTLRSTVEVSLHEGKDVLLEVDVQGAQSVKRLFLKLCSFSSCRHPWMNSINGSVGGTDTPEAIDLRLRCAPDELQAAKNTII